MKMKLTHLDLTWSTSRAQDTYGYNIARLDDGTTGKRYRTSGGGYDMVGTVFGNWLEDVYQDRLVALKESAASTWHKSTGVTDRNTKPHWFSHGDKPVSEGSLYGFTYYADEGRVALDGACGLSCMTDIAKAIGLDVESTHNKKGNTTGWFIMEPQEVA